MTGTVQSWRGELSDLRDDVRECLHRGEEITRAVVQNARSAANHWALWEAINEKLGGEDLRQALRWRAPSGIAEVREALAISTVMAILRVSDNPQNEDSLSACLLRGLLANAEVTDVLISETWLTRGDVSPPSGIVEIELAEQPGRIEWFKENVPLGWRKGDHPADSGRLKETREALRDIRTKIIAHAISGEVCKPEINEVRRALEVAVEIAQTASLIFLGHTSGLDQDFSKRTKRYDEFWGFFEHGLVSQYRDWRAKADAAGLKPN